MKMANQLIKLLLSAVLLCPSLVLNQSFLFESQGFYLGGLVVSASENKASNKTPKKTRRTPAMRERIYRQLARAQKLADEEKVDEGLAVLDRVKSRIDQINSYEKAMLWNFYGFIYYGKNDTKNAVAAFEKVVEQTNIPESLELSTLFSLAQLSMADENYAKAISYIDRWSKIKGGELSNDGLVLKANAYYATKNYKKSVNAVSKAVTNRLTQGKLPKENWLVLKRALHYELKQYDKVTEVSEQLVRHYSKPKYWIELANMYGKIDQSDKQLAVMEAAYQQGFVTKRSDIQTLAQLYFAAGVPYKSAELLSKSIESGLVLENIKILNYLAQAWTSAKEIDKAVSVLVRAANMSLSGNLDAKLAEAFLELEQWDNAITSAKKAKQKGNLDNSGSVDVILGIAYFNLNKFSSAINNFELAMKDKRQKKIAKQWLRYTKKEKTKYERLKS